ncbi:hypothetical protein GCK72_013822 [Caenorhabditis remanei]|uniref:Uncharacterized protein n=1 Tax=Caenorhabditis remanei TaxID=31234 RepID=A0A6A5GQ99_CAERE|nr:hypothetical protein GCK72_013822 [Caenorhabditis remanei]KAF1757367.1 hypothetical protein GCK72_013822 [Caenorhabditis remanei]
MRTTIFPTHPSIWNPTTRQSRVEIVDRRNPQITTNLLTIKRSPKDQMIQKMVEIGGDSVLLEDRNGQCLLYKIRRMAKPQWTIVSKEPCLSINVTSQYVCLERHKNTVENRDRRLKGALEENQRYESNFFKVKKKHEDEGDVDSVASQKVNEGPKIEDFVHIRDVGQGTYGLVGEYRSKRTGHRVLRP